MATWTEINDPALDLEQNLKCIASNLFDLVDTDEGISLSPISTSTSYNSMDSYNSSSLDTGMFSSSPELNSLEYQVKLQSDLPGYASMSTQQRYAGIISNQIPPPPPGYYGLPLKSNNPVFVPQMNGFNGIQLPTAALLPINTAMPYMQAVMVPSIQTFPFIQSPVVGNNVRDLYSGYNKSDSILLTETETNEYPKYSYNVRRGHSFHKKYPRRSDRDFMVVPHIQSKGLENEMENIDLRKLKIGPDYLYQSEQTKLLNKFKEAISALSDLSNERRDIKSSGVKTEKDLIGKNVCSYYQFSQYLSHILKVAKEEYKVVEMIIKDLEASCSVLKTELDKRGSVVLKEMLHEINRLQQLDSLTIIKGDELDINRKPNEVKMVKDTLSNFISSVRNVAVDIWCLKVWYQGLECGQNKSSALV